MAKEKPYRSLTARLLLTLVAAGALALLAGFLLNFAGSKLADKVYDSPKNHSRRELTAITSLREYVREKSIFSTDAEGIGYWNTQHPYIRLMVSANGTVLSSDRWGAELVLADNGLVFNIGANAREGTDYVVNFRDGAYVVQVQEFSLDRVYNLVRAVSFVTAVLLFLAMILLYSSAVTREITRLARQVRQVSQGDLTLAIEPSSGDEIGGLAEDVDAMRLSIIDKLRREEEAWQANTGLITAISHDVRTPLTALLGYLEILQQSPGLSAQRQEEYLRLCSQKAEKLRELTDELFSYFLVFGKPEPDQEPEEFEAQALLEQLLGEPAAELTARGYRVEFSPLPEEGRIRVDVQHLHRVMDNLVSNLLKYADPEAPISMAANWVGSQLEISVSNRILKAATRPESTRIGLQTCEKLLTAMGGSFRRIQTPTQFTAVAVLPRLED